MKIVLVHYLPFFTCWKYLDNNIQVALSYHPHLVTLILKLKLTDTSLKIFNAYIVLSCKKW